MFVTKENNACTIKWSNEKYPFYEGKSLVGLTLGLVFLVDCMLCENVTLETDF